VFDVGRAFKLGNPLFERAGAVPPRLSILAIVFRLDLSYNH